MPCADAGGGGREGETRTYIMPPRARLLCFLCLCPVFFLFW